MDQALRGRPGGSLWRHWHFRNEHNRADNRRGVFVRGRDDFREAALVDTEALSLNWPAPCRSPRRDCVWWYPCLLRVLRCGYIGQASRAFTTETGAFSVAGAAARGR